MTNLEKYNDIFMKVLKADASELEGLVYRRYLKWDSFAHMNLVGELEECFDIMLETPDMLAFSTYVKGKEIMAKYGIDIE